MNMKQRFHAASSVEEKKKALDEASEKINRIKIGFRGLIEAEGGNKDGNFIAAALIGILGSSIGATAGNDRKKQDDMIDFVRLGIKIVLVENNYREMDEEVFQQLPPWEKN